MIADGWDSWFPQAIVDTPKVYDLYGDKIIVGVDPKIDPKGQDRSGDASGARVLSTALCSL